MQITSYNVELELAHETCNLQIPRSQKSSWNSRKWEYLHHGNLQLYKSGLLFTLHSPTPQKIGFPVPCQSQELREALFSCFCHETVRNRTQGAERETLEHQLQDEDIMGSRMRGVREIHRLHNALLEFQRSLARIWQNLNMSSEEESENTIRKGN